MADFKDFPTNFILAGLFITAMIGFAVGLAGNYDKDESLMKSDQIDFSGIEDQLKNATEQSAKWQKAFTGDNPLLDFGALILFSIWGLGKLMWGSVTTMLSIFLIGFENVLGIPPLVTASITAIIIIYLIFKLWRVIKAGE